jgi:hypothetical protein
MFESPDKLILGFLTGVLFGFLLQKGRVAKFEVIVGQFLLRDWTVVKTMGTRPKQTAPMRMPPSSAGRICSEAASAATSA